MNSFSARLAVEVLLGLVVEVVELALEDRDDVTRNVLADLRVLEGALAHHAKVPNPHPDPVIWTC